MYGVQFLVGTRDFSLLRNLCTSSGTHPDSFQWVSGIISKWVKWLWYKAGVQDAWNNASIPPLCLHIMDRDNLNFSFYLSNTSVMWHYRC